MGKVQIDTGASDRTMRSEKLQFGVNNPVK